jgi:hypothetical protein
MADPGKAAFDRAEVERFLGEALVRLSGDWLLLGGALVALWLEPDRMTEDIDLIGFAGAAQERHALMQLTADLGLPIESVNSAADFFVHRIADWREQLAPLRSSERARIFRPNATLFLLLKIGRLTARDLEDCESLLHHVAADGAMLDRGRVLAALDSLVATADLALLSRRTRLRALL